MENSASSDELARRVAVIGTRLDLLRGTMCAAPVNHQTAQGGKLDAATVELLERRLQLITWAPPAP